MKRNSTTRSLLVLGVAAAVLFAGGVAGLTAAVPADGTVASQGNQTNATNQTNGTNVTNQTNATATVTFTNQTSNGTVVFVENVSLSEGGFVAIHNESLLQNQTVSSDIGASSYLEPGAYQNVSVTLYNVSGANFTNASLSQGNYTLIAMPHLDTNGNQSFDFVATNGSEDGPYTLANGTAVTDQAMVEVTGGNATANVTMNATNATNATVNATNATNATNVTNSSVAAEP